MKKRFLAAALALVLAIGLAIPVFAADESSSSVPAVDIHLPGSGGTKASTGTYQVRRASAMALTDKSTGTTLGRMITRSSEPRAFELTVYPLPLGTTITISHLRNDWKSSNHITDIVGMQAYSEPGSVTLSTDYLHNVFGPNTLVLVQLQIWTAINTESLTALQTGTTATLACLITGEKAPDAPAADSPAAPDTPAPVSTDFTDVAPGAYYAAPAAVWAVEQKITTGTGDGTTFSPNDVCSRGQIMAFLYRNLA